MHRAARGPRKRARSRPQVGSRYGGQVRVQGRIHAERPQYHPMFLWQLDRNDSMVQRRYNRYNLWHFTSFLCVLFSVFCPFPGFVENGKVLLVGAMGLYEYRPYVRKIRNNRQIMFQCSRGYELVGGPTGATCIDGHWSPPQLPR